MCMWMCMCSYYIHKSHYSKSIIIVAMLQETLHSSFCERVYLVSIPVMNTCRCCACARTRVSCVCMCVYGKIWNLFTHMQAVWMDAVRIWCTKAHTSRYDAMLCVKQAQKTHTHTRTLTQGDRELKRTWKNSIVVCQFQWYCMHVIHPSMYVCVRTLWACAKHVIVYLNNSRIIRSCYFPNIIALFSIFKHLFLSRAFLMCFAHFMLTNMNW